MEITPAVHMSLLLWDIVQKWGIINRVCIQYPAWERGGGAAARPYLPMSSPREAKAPSPLLPSRPHDLARSRARRSSFSINSLYSTTMRLISKRTSMQMRAMMIFSRKAPWSVSYISRMTVAISWA